MISKELILGTQEYIQPTSFHFWDDKEEKMYDVKEISFDRKGMPINIIVFTNDINTETEIKSYLEGDLIPSTGIYESQRKELYYGDIVVCKFLPGKYKVRVVYWDNGWRVFGVSTNEFENNSLDMVFKIGNRWEEKKLFEDYKKRITSQLK